MEYPQDRCDNCGKDLDRFADEEIETRNGVNRKTGKAYTMTICPWCVEDEAETLITAAQERDLELLLVQTRELRQDGYHGAAAKLEEVLR